jgi:uncharacterized membrane protein
MLSSRWKMKLSRIEGSLDVEIPSRCRLGDVVLHAIWTILWAMFGVLGGYAQLAQYSRSPWLLAVIGALSLWGVALAMAVWKLAYWLAGSERLRASADELTIERGVRRFRSRRTIPAREISACRVSPRRHWVQDFQLPQMMRIPRPDDGAITVIHGRTAVRFGRNLGAEEAEALASDLADCLGCRRRLTRVRS